MSSRNVTGRISQRAYRVLRRFVRQPVGYGGNDILKGLIKGRDIVEGVFQNTSYQSTPAYPNAWTADLPICKLSTVRSDVVQANLSVRVSIQPVGS